MKMPHMIDVVCALIENSDGQLLVCKRAATTHLNGHWEFPGGKVESGESNQAALEREILEELGVQIEVGVALQPVDWNDDKVSIRLRPYCCQLVSGELRPHEHELIQWCDLAELQDLKWAPADIPILEEWLMIRPE